MTKNIMQDCVQCIFGCMYTPHWQYWSVDLLSYSLFLCGYCTVIASHAETGFYFSHLTANWQLSE